MLYLKINAVVKTGPSRFVERQCPQDIHIGLPMPDLHAEKEGVGTDQRTSSSSFTIAVIRVSSDLVSLREPRMLTGMPSREAPKSRT